MMLSGNRLSATGASSCLTPSTRLETILSSPPPHPMVVLPAEGGFWSDPPPPGDERKEVDNSTIAANQQYYKNFRGVEHNNYCCVDPTLGPVVLSIKYNQESCLAQVVSRTTSGNKYHSVDLNHDKENKDNINHDKENKDTARGDLFDLEVDGRNLKEGLHDPIPVTQLVQIGQDVVPGLDVHRLIRLKAKGVVEQLIDFDDYIDSNVKHLKFGLIYQKVGQTTEEELFGNQEHSEAMDSFMEMLGTKVDLMEHKGYLGGLQAVDSLTGEKSLYTEFKDKEIMFHVSTFLPHSNTDQHQIQKKRHIGNDIMSLVFQDGETPFSPDMIQSQFLNAYIIIRPSNQQYQVCVTAKEAVKQFEPILPENATFKSGPELREWLLNKLISGRKSCYRSERFTKIFLDSLVQQLLAEEAKANKPQNKSVKSKSRSPLGDCWPTCCARKHSTNSIYQKFI